MPQELKVYVIVFFNCNELDAIEILAYDPSQAVNWFRSNWWLGLKKGESVKIKSVSEKIDRSEWQTEGGESGNAIE